MASTSSSSLTAPSASSSSSRPLEESRPQAGPLPVKRGEIGYSEEVHGSTEEASGSTSEPVNLPDRHPADRDHPPAASNTSNSNNDTTPSSNPTSTTTPSANVSTPDSTSDDSSSTNSLKNQKKRCLTRFLHPKKTVTYGGIKLATLIAFALQLLVVGGTLAGWVIAAVMISGKKQGGTSQDNSNGPNGANMAQSSVSASIFIHVVFAIAFLGQLLFLERRIFVIRAQRYAHLHGDILPSTRRRGLPAGNIAIAPWNRPPLPSYARALAESGVGTGDVEDNEIAVVPPPAYGNTRGSTLLLSGFLRNSLRAQRPASERTETGSRPVSYASRDDDWEVIQDADRAARLEDTLTTLEGPTSRQRT